MIGRKAMAFGAILGLATAARAAEVGIGINYNWWRLNPAGLGECPTHPAAVFWGGGIIAQYRDESVRQTVRQQLELMRKAGFTSIRTAISERRPFNDRLEGPLVSENGAISEQDRVSVQAFVSDIAAAGFTTTEIAFGFLEENSPYCHRVHYGDCFEPSRTDENWRFIAGATEAVEAAAGRMSLRFDLAGEGCPAANMPNSTLTNASRYLQTIARRFQVRFGDRWLISCADSPRAQRLGVLLEVLASAGLSPKFVEVHSYRTEPGYLESVLDSANSMAERINAGLVLGEMRYHSSEQGAQIADWLRRTPYSRLIDVIEWPLADPSSHCHIDTPPPYTPGPILALKSID